MLHKHVNRCCWFCAQILLPEDWSLMLTATLFCIELPPGPLSHHFPKPLTSGWWPIPCLCSTVAAPDLPMDQAKAIPRGDHILVQISYSALFCFSYSFIKKSHSQETLPHTASGEPPEDNLVPSNLQCYLSSPESKLWRQLFTENGHRAVKTCRGALRLARRQSGPRRVSVCHPHCLQARVCDWLTGPVGTLLMDGQEGWLVPQFCTLALIY